MLLLWCFGGAEWRQVGKYADPHSPYRAKPERWQPFPSVRSPASLKHPDWASKVDPRLKSVVFQSQAPISHSGHSFICDLGISALKRVSESRECLPSTCGSTCVCAGGGGVEGACEWPCGSVFMCDCVCSVSAYMCLHMSMSVWVKVSISVYTPCIYSHVWTHTHINSARWFGP